MFVQCLFQVVQIYFEWQNNARLPVPKIQLGAFERYFLKVGDKQTYTLKIEASQLQVWDELAHQYVILPGIKSFKSMIFWVILYSLICGDSVIEL